MRRSKKILLLSYPFSFLFRSFGFYQERRSLIPKLFFWKHQMDEIWLYLWQELEPATRAGKISQQTIGKKSKINKQHKKKWQLLTSPVFGLRAVYSFEREGTNVPNLLMETCFFSATACYETMNVKCNHDWVVQLDNTTKKPFQLSISLSSLTSTIASKVVVKIRLVSAKDKWCVSATLCTMSSVETRSLVVPVVLEEDNDDDDDDDSSEVEKATCEIRVLRTRYTFVVTKQYVVRNIVF